MLARDPRLGRLLGPWRLLSPLGAGGMGSVYLAERADMQFQKRVAVKIVRFGLDSEGMMRRFYRERQILAELEHPNIARLLDGGVTDDGFPYLVMEQVEGKRIDVCCRELGLSTKEKLFLFRKVCSAVRYLHSHLIVHCDLKPSNILVTADAEPILLDFGIARLSNESDSAQQTSTAMLFTPRYASPEQAQSKPVSTRCDVYSLGVILHELLTGRSPYGDEDRTPLEWMRAVELQEAIAPSRCVKDKVLVEELSGELDHIVMKALRKDPAERYASVEQFDADVGRYLEGDAVLAQPQTFRYRLRKFVWKNRGPVLAAVLIALVLVAGSAATLYQARVAERERARAERRFDQVRELARLILFDFHDRVQRLPGSTQLQRELVDKTLQHLEGLAKEASGDSKLLAELAESYLRLADVQGNPYSPNLGEPNKALQTYTRAIELLAAVPEGAGTANLEHARAKLHRERGLLRVSLNARNEAKAEIQKAITLFESLVRREPDSIPHRSELASTWGALADSITGNSWARAAGPGDVVEAYNRSLGEWREVLRLRPSDARAQRAVALCLVRIGGEEGDQDSGKALARFQAAWSQLSSMAAAEKSTPEWKRLAGITRMNEGRALADLERYPEALEVFGALIQQRRDIVAADAENRQAALDLLHTVKVRGDIQYAAGHFAESLTDYGEAGEMVQKMLARDPKDAGRKDSYADLLRCAARSYMRVGNAAEADRNARRALAIRKEIADDPNADPQSVLIYAFTTLQIEPEQLRQPREGLAYYRKAKASGKPVPKDLDKWIADLEAQLSKPAETAK